MVILENLKIGLNRYENLGNIFIMAFDSNKDKCIVIRKCMYGKNGKLTRRKDDN